MARKSRKQCDAAPVIQEKKIYSAGAYIRLSVLDKKQKGDSIETQQAIINSFIAEHADIELRDVYIDNGLSGQSFERPEFQRMIADMEGGKIDCCITKDLSRFGRNAIDAGFYIERYFPAHGIRFVAVTDNYDSVDGKNGGIMISLKNMINEAYALDIGRKIRAVFQTNIRNGCFVGGMAPYGYLKSSDDCHKLVIDESAAQIIRRMYEMAADGQSAQAILAWLNDSKILSPSRYLHSIGKATEKQVGAHIHWSLQAVRRILSNRIYCGDMVQGKHKAIGVTSQKLPESEWTVTENTHEAIVSREVFAEVQKLWDKPDGARQAYYKKPQSENVFPGKVFCGHCGFSMVRKRGGEKYYGYKCNSRLLYSKDACGGMYITETVLKKTLLEMIRAQRSFLAQSASAPVDAVPNACKDELAAIRSELDTNNRFLKSLFESLILGDITDSEFKEMKAGYEAKIALLTKRETGYPPRKYAISCSRQSIRLQRNTRIGSAARIFYLSACGRQGSYTGYSQTNSIPAAMFRESRNQRALAPKNLSCMTGRHGLSGRTVIRLLLAGTILRGCRRC